MLILARKAGESIRIGNDVKLTVIKLRRNEIRLGIEAPEEIVIRTPGQDDPDGGQGGSDSQEDH